MQNRVDFKAGMSGVGAKNGLSAVFDRYSPLQWLSILKINHPDATHATYFPSSWPLKSKHDRETFDMYERPSIKALLLLSALSLSVSRNAISDESLVKQGSVLKVDQAAAVRTSPPTEKFLFFVGQPGKTIQMLPRGRTFKVDEVKEISVPFGKDIWVKGKTSEGATGWVYYGDKDKSVNFEKK